MTKILFSIVKRANSAFFFSCSLVLHWKICVNKVNSSSRCSLLCCYFAVPSCHIFRVKIWIKTTSLSEEWWVGSWKILASLSICNLFLLHNNILDFIITTEQRKMTTEKISKNTNWIGGNNGKKSKDYANDCVWWISLFSHKKSWIMS